MLETRMALIKAGIRSAIGRRHAGFEQMKGSFEFVHLGLSISRGFLQLTTLAGEGFLLLVG